MRGADNMIIHHADGTTTNIGDMKVNTRNTVLQQANMTYTNTGAEYLLYLEGATGKPYIHCKVYKRYIPCKPYKPYIHCKPYPLAEAYLYRHPDGTKWRRGS